MDIGIMMIIIVDMKKLKQTRTAQHTQYGAMAIHSVQG